ncbi:AI-2E family transporter [Candidatus Roizmanbacteria bacterium]|nr:AI-2E family transporter [Candidatus Roizmanbacteria bacterium]
MKANYFKFLPSITTSAVILLILYLSFLVLKPLLFVILISTVFSIFLNPVYEWLFLHLKRRALSAFISIFLLLLCIIFPVLLISGGIAEEARTLIDNLQKNPTLLNDIRNYIIEKAKYYGLPSEVTQFNLQDEAVTLLTTIVRNIGSSIVYAGSAILNTFFVLIITFFFLIHKKNINSYLMRIQLIPKEYFIQFQNRIIELVNGIVRGNLLIAVMQSAIGMLGFLMFGLPTPILLGVAYGLLSLIPAIGVALVWVPIAIILFINQGSSVTILFILWFTLTNLAMDNFVSPRIIGRHTKLHQLLIMFAVIGGVAQFGIIGIVLGPVIIALAFVAIGMYNELLKEANN